MEAQNQHVAAQADGKPESLGAIAASEFEDRLAAACIACGLPESIFESLCIEMQIRGKN